MHTNYAVNNIIKINTLTINTMNMYAHVIHNTIYYTFRVDYTHS